MKVLVVGSGGREHAICWTFTRSKRVDRLFCANGNAGIAEIAECVPIRPDDLAGLKRFAAENDLGLTFVGGEGALAAGIVDEFQASGLPIVGPGRSAAALESSKAFAKDFMVRNGIPTAAYATFDSPGDAVKALESGRFGGPDEPVVVKADGLAAGKGVIVATNRAEAVTAVGDLRELVGDPACSRIILEEHLSGTEVSLLMFAAGESYSLMPPTRDHKRIGEGDTGPNTGGMGTITDASLLSADQLSTIEASIIRPTLQGCIAEGMTYRGILFLGLMMTDDGAKVLEYNVRFGDPETQAILVRLETDLTDICDAMLGGSLDALPINWRAGSSACVVLASDGYPGRARTGDRISGLSVASAMDGIRIFHAATAVAEGGLVTSGGRVLGVTAVADELDQALTQAYAAIDEISWPGMQFRRDIGC